MTYRTILAPGAPWPGKVEKPKPQRQLARDSMLSILQAHPGSTNAELATFRGVRRNSMSRSIARMREAGLIETITTTGKHGKQIGRHYALDTPSEQRSVYRPRRFDNAQADSIREQRDSGMTFEALALANSASVTCVYSIVNRQKAYAPGFV